MELFIILLKSLALLIALLLMIIGLASVSVFIYLQFVPFPEEGSQEAEPSSETICKVTKEKCRYNCGNQCYKQLN